MDVNFTGQAATFLTTLAVGAMLSIVFDFYRVLRGIFKPRSVATGFFDLLYWLVATLVVFGALLMSNWGELRLYIFIGLAGGAIIYFRLFSRYVVLMLIRLIRLFFFVVNWLKTIACKFLIRPFMYCIGLLFLPFAYAGRRTAAPRRRFTGWLKRKLYQPPDQDQPPP